VFREAARAAGIALPAPQIARPGTRGEVLASYSSASVNEITESMLRYSTNLTAEVLGLAATRASGRPAPDLAASAAAMNDWAAGLGGFQPGDPAFRLMNHSGLSAASRVSPERMMALLIGAHRHPTLGPQLRAVLRNHPVPPPEAATPGAKPKPGAKRTGPEAVILAKTGTLNFTRGLAGYITTPSGRELVFAYFANDLARRQAGLDDEAPDPGARAWRNAAITQERALLARWIAAYN
jgi:D-alanyl-D-alanine carboxypeptidase/D-alanyl-D-alanine-endopeptidase (penicillin-binding protein 4)